MKTSLPLAALLLLQLSCASDTTGPEPHRFNVIVQYGVLAKNELNTFENTVTKDLILDGTITTRLVLTPVDFDSIESWFLGSNIMSYPDTFVTPPADTSLIIAIYSHANTYTLEIFRDDQWKRLWWHDNVFSTDNHAERLRRFFWNVQQLVESKPAYRSLPPARGGYI